MGCSPAVAIAGTLQARACEVHLPTQLGAGCHGVVGVVDNDGLLVLLLLLLQSQARYKPALAKRIYLLNLALDARLVCW
jgi:hypothetical protein